MKCTFSLSLTNISVSEVVLTRQNQGSLDVSYWRMTLLDPWPAHGLSIRLVVVVCASLRVLLHSWCLRAGVGALLRLHGRWSWLPSPGVVSGRCSVRRPLGVTPSEGFVSCKTPTATVVERRAPEGPQGLEGAGGSGGPEGLAAVSGAAAGPGPDKCRT